MPYKYSAQNHDWDLTLHAAAELISAGLIMDKRPKTGNLSMGFSFFTGGMVLSFAAVESFSASVAFTMRSDDRFPGFDFENYRKSKQFWLKIELLMSAAEIKIDKRKGLFRDLADMQRWRNLVTHASPYEIHPTEIEETISAPGKLHRKSHHLEYTRTVDSESARRFYGTAVSYIDLVKERTGLDPRASATYEILE